MRWTETAYRQQTRGFTLVEVLVVVAIVALLVGVLVGVTKHIDTKKKEALTESCLNLLKTAVTEYHDITGHYPIDRWVDGDGDGVFDDPPVGDPYHELVGCRLVRASLADGSPDPRSDELLYLQLSMLPQTRDIIRKLAGQLVAEPNSRAIVRIAGRETPYLRSIVDGWEEPLIYTQPRIYSSGPDRQYPTGDDISDGS